MIAERRRQPVVVGAQQWPASFLKHAEDQTVLALAAVACAIEQAGWHDRSFADWGVIAAPSWFGRVSIAQSIQRFQKDGAWGVSPHLIPQQSLHGMSGAISQALKIHGPNFGVSGGPNPAPDAFLVAAALMADGVLPGLWVVLTAHEAEWIPAADDRAVLPPACRAVALALTPTDIDESGLHLSIGQANATDAATLAHLADFQLGLFAEGLTAGAPGAWRLSERHWLELEAAGLDAEVSP